MNPTNTSASASTPTSSTSPQPAQTPPGPLQPAHPRPPFTAPRQTTATREYFHTNALDEPHADIEDLDASWSEPSSSGSAGSLSASSFVQISRNGEVGGTPSPTPSSTPSDIVLGADLEDVFVLAGLDGRMREGSAGAALGERKGVLRRVRGERERDREEG
ncbi:hypothetical protein IQ07DRAFT_605545 [Pyrenochaeta sp. DS3sAY3a]|nr:hypothetical protein IQ07DRAFT_605545 [Pyrenochaeta sp. DS3sAY3a]